MKIYTVDADRETGEWLSDPIDMNESTTAQEWATRQDTDDFHYDTFERGDDPLTAETAAIVCRFV